MIGAAGGQRCVVQDRGEVGLPAECARGQRILGTPFSVPTALSARAWRACVWRRGYLLTQVLGGVWADKYGAKRVLGFGVVWW